MAFKFGKTPQNSLMSKLYPNGQSVPQLPGVSAQVPAQTTAIQSQIKPQSFGATPANISRTNLLSQNTVPIPVRTISPALSTPQAQPQNANAQLEAIKSALGGISSGLHGLQMPKEAPKPDALAGIEAELAKAQTPTQEEQDTQKTLSNLLASEELGLAAVQNKPIAMPFITGQQAAIQRTAAVQAMPLQAQLAAAQSRRQAALDVAKSKLEVEKTRRAEKTVPDSGFTLSPGQTRYDSQGKIIGNAPKAVGVDDDKILSVTEAQALGVPYGTTQGQAKGLGVTGKPTVEQSKARQFAVTADQANQILNSNQYDPGYIENPYMPNALKGTQRQQFEQAARAFVNAVLRRESGATITDSEFSNKYKELIDSAGDGPEVKTQKQLARDAAVKSIQEAGNSAASIGGNEMSGVTSSGIKYTVTNP